MPWPYVMKIALFWDNVQFSPLCAYSNISAYYNHMLFLFNSCTISADRTLLWQDGFFLLNFDHSYSFAVESSLWTIDVITKRNLTMFSCSWWTMHNIRLQKGYSSSKKSNQNKKPNKQKQNKQILLTKVKK